MQSVNAHRGGRVLLEGKRRREGAGGRARVDVELALALVRAEDVRVPGDEHVAVELTLQRAERLRVAPRHDLVAVAEPELELADLDRLGLRQAVGNVWQERSIVKVAAHHVHIARQRPKVIVSQLIDDVSRAEDVLDFAGLEERLELFWQVRAAVRDVHIAYDEDEDHRCD